MNNKKVIIFLCINFLAALFLLHDGSKSSLLVAQESTSINTKLFFNKIKTIFDDNNTNVAKTEATQITQTQESNITTPSNPSKNVDIKHINPKESPQVVVVDSKKTNSCSIFGPLSSENEELAQNILVKNANDYEIIQKPIFEIYWSLGKDEKLAQSLYQRSKSTGFIKEDKHKFEQDKNGMYYVSINKIDNSEQETIALINKIQEQANQIKTGGKWSYRKTHELPYLKIKDITDLNTKTMNNIKTNLGYLEQSCI